MSAQSAALATPHEFIDGDKTYKARLFTRELMGEFESHLYAVHCSASRPLKDLMDAHEWRAHLKGLADQKVAGEYQIESLAGVNFIKTTNGIIWLVQTLFNVTANVATDLIVRHGAEIGELVNGVLCESIPSFKSAHEHAQKAEAEAKAKADAKADAATETQAETQADPNAAATPPA